MAHESELALEAWRLHREASASEPHVRVTPKSAPILFFGDVEAYRRSQLRVVTVGVNPSGEEFPVKTPWSRLPLENLAGGHLEAEHMPIYLNVLNDYFRRNPYDKWFKRSYEPVLNGMGTSYYDHAEATAIHTDVCTPIPTTPAWGQLTPEERRFLAPYGVALWHRLVADLEPHVILASISARHFARISLPALSEPEVIYTVEQVRPCRIVAHRVRCGSTHSLLIHGAAATTPFQMIKDSQKRAVGAVVHGLVNG